MNRLLSAIAALRLLVARPAGAADPAPILVLETGVHEAAINAMAAMRDGSGFVTVSDDKTARIWRDGGQEAGEVLRPPIGRGDDGALYSVAVSAKVIGVSGRVPALQGGYGIALYSAQDYRPLGMIPGLPTAAMAMKMSPAGDRLAVGLEIGGLRVYNLSPLGIALEDTDYPSQITSLDFDPAGRLAVAAGDNSVRL